MIIQPTVCLTIFISKKICKIITIDLSKQQALNVNSKAIQHISFTGNLDQSGQ